MTTLNQIQDDFTLLTDWEDRYSYIIDLGRELAPLNAAEMVEANKVSGCTSQVWLISEPSEQGRIIFRAASDSTIVQGLLAIVLAIYSGKTAAEIAAADPEQIMDNLGLAQNLSPNRRNGFTAVVAKIKAIANAKVA